MKVVEMSKHAKLEVEESEYTVSELTKTPPKVRVHGVVTSVSPMKEGTSSLVAASLGYAVCAACKFIASKFVVSLP